MKDFIGQELKAGDAIVYPGRRYSSMWMNKGYITKIVGGRLYVDRIPLNKWENLRGVVITEVQRVVKVSENEQFGRFE